MPIPASLIRTQLMLTKQFLKGCTLETIRLGQDMLGELMTKTHGRNVTYLPVIFDDFMSEWVIPKSLNKNSVILYLHGGGFVAGNIEYAKGFGTILAAKNSVKVFCPAYRLAPEHQYPCALDDAFSAYKYILGCGYSPKDIFLCGESAGGGLLYSLCMKLRDEGMCMPAGIIAMSPWTDHTIANPSYDRNKEADPSLTLERMSFFAASYSDQPQNPYVSPLFGELDGMPPSLIFVGSSEILMDDACRMHERLLEYNSKSELIIAKDMWHAYILYGVADSKAAHEKISLFIEENAR